MKLTKTLLVTCAFLVMAGSAWAHGCKTSTTATASTNTSTTVTASTAASTTARTTATTTATARTGLDVRLESAATTLSSDATRMGDEDFAARLGARLGVSADLLTQQRSQFDASWGDLALAYSVAMTSRTKVTVDQIFGMRADGASWTAIAATLRVPPGRLMTSVSTQVETFDTEATAGVSGRQAARSRTFSRIESRLNTRLDAFEAEAARIGDQAMAERLSAQFGVSAATLLTQKTQGATWGDLLIAYTVAARTRSSVTVNQILTMRASGRTWSDIATSLRLPGGRLLTGVGMETRDIFSARASAAGAARLRERSSISVQAGKVLRGGWKASMRSDAVMKHGASLSAAARLQAISSSGARNTALMGVSTSAALRSQAALRASQSAMLRANVRMGLARTNR